MVSVGYKQTEIGVIPTDWDDALIGENFNFKNGLNKAKSFFGYGFPIINYMDVFKHASVVNSDIKGKVDVNSSEVRAYSVRKGDVFFTRTSETPQEIGISTVLLSDLYSGVFSGFVLRARPTTTRFNDGFKKYCFSSNVVRRQIQSTSSYTTRALTNGRLLSNVRVPLPRNEEEQKAIAEALSDVDALIESLEKLIAKKRAIKTASMQELLTGKTRLPGFNGEWQESQIQDFGHFKSGNGFPVKYQGHQKGAYPFFKVSDMNNFGNATRMVTSNNYISESVRKSLNVNIVPPNSIVFAKIGAAIFLERKKITVCDSCIDNNMMAFIPDHEISDYSFFLYLF